MANTSLKDNIYKYLNGVAAVKNSVMQIGWGQMPDTAVTKTQIVYSMLNDNRLQGSQFRDQLWRFWICFPSIGTKPKDSVLNAGNILLNNLHNISGTFGDVNILYAENVSNQDPFFDTASNSYIVIQDYKLKMRTLEV